MKILLKTFLIIIFSINFAYSACDLIAEFGEKKEVFEKREIATRPFPMEYAELDVYPVLANDICPNQKLNDVGIEYRFLNDELVAINFAYSACDLIAEFGEKKEVFEKREIIGRPFPLEYPELEVFPV